MRKLLTILALVISICPALSSQQRVTKPYTVQVAVHNATLTWAASTSIVAGYKVYRGPVSGGPYTLRASTASNVLTYQDSVGQSGTTYYWVVTAFDSMGVESIYSNQVSGTVP